MVKRKGVNSRKRMVQRKKKVAGSIRKHARTVLVVAVVAVALYAVVNSKLVTPTTVVTAVKHSKILSVRSVSVKGNRLVAAEEVLMQCGLSGTTGLLEVNSAAVSAALARNPWIEEARCVKRLWGKIVIEIRERVPVAIVNAGEVFLVDRYGRIIPVEPKTQYDLPLVNGLSIVNKNDGMKCVDSAAVERMNTFFECIRRSNPKLFRVIPQFDMSSASCVRGYAVEPQTIVEMDYTIDREQLVNMGYMLETLATRSDVPERINVQYQNLAFVTMKRNNND